MKTRKMLFKHPKNAFPVCFKRFHIKLEDRFLNNRIVMIKYYLCIYFLIFNYFFFLLFYFFFSNLALRIYLDDLYKPYLSEKTL